MTMSDNKFERERHINILCLGTFDEGCMYSEYHNVTNQRFFIGEHKGESCLLNRKIKYIPEVRLYYLLIPTLICYVK